MNNPEDSSELAGGGEMGALIKAKDWSITPLGDRRLWPQSLLTTLDIMLNSRFPMCLFWGKEFIQIYNDAFRSSLGTDGRHPSVLGEKAEVSWPELWKDLQPFLTGILETGEATWNEDHLIPIFRNGRMEESYWTCSHSPVRDESGKISGIFLTGIETTGKIMSLKKAEESEKNFRNLVNEAPVATAIFLGENFLIELANDEALKLWEKDRSVIGKTVLEAMPELNNQPYIQLLKDVYTTGKTYEGIENLAYLEANGELKPKHVTFIYKALYNPAGEIYGILTMGYEVTEQLEARKKITDAEERSRLAVDSAMLGTFDVDVKNNKLICSPRFCEIFGYESATISYEQILDVIHPDDMPVREEAHRKSRETGFLHYEARLIWKDGSMHWMSVQGKLFFDDDKKPLRILGTVMDITEKKIALEELLEKEKKFSLLADSMPQFVWLGDANGNLNYFNKAVFSYSGLTPDEVMNGGWLTIVHPDDRDENLHRWKHSVDTGEDFLFEHRFRRHDGEYRWQMSRAVPQKDNYGNIQMWVGTSTDIHDRKLFTDGLESSVHQRTKELHLLNEQLVKSNKDLAEFAYVASHDLQEPLRKIQTFATRIIDFEKNNLSEKGKDYFMRMQSAAKRMQQLIVDLLSYSRANTSERYFEVCNLNELLQTVKEQLNEAIEQKKAIIQSAELPSLNIIPYQFEQLLTNIIGNSLKFSKEGVVPEIYIDYSIEDGKNLLHSDNAKLQYHHIRISDNGIGFDSQYSERIFQVFQRLHGNSEYSGTGIGLAIVKKIVENHNGILRAEGEENAGATFHIYLPAENQ